MMHTVELGMMVADGGGRNYERGALKKVTEKEMQEKSRENCSPI